MTVHFHVHVNKINECHTAVLGFIIPHILITINRLI